MVVRECKVSQSVSCKGCSKTRVSGPKRELLLLRILRLRAEAVKLDERRGKQESAQCNVLHPSSPPAAGMSCCGSDAIANIMLGKKPSGLLIERSIETSIVIAGGYSRGAGSKVAGRLKEIGVFHRRVGTMQRNIRRGYIAMREVVTRAWHINSATVNKAQR